MKKRGEENLAVYVGDKDYMTSLEIGKIYLAIPDNNSAELSLIRNHLRRDGLERRYQ
ncbi:MAG: hypothetical protein ABFD12_05400 [Syntrophorhabdus sp.]